jgi:pimeloyl-ACP methyl ester carboxylesterase
VLPVSERTTAGADRPGDAHTLVRQPPLFFARLPAHPIASATPRRDYDWLHTRRNATQMKGNAMTEHSPPPGSSALRQPLSRRAALGRAAGASAALTGAAYLSRTSVFATQRGNTMAQATPTPGSAPTVVLVHGAFADASGWSGVIAELQADGIATLAPANPLRSVSGDAAYIASVVNQIPGPVLLVGHSYGGVVITNAAVQTPNVVGLVYICAFLPDEGESVQDLAAQATDSLLGSNLRPAQYDGGGAEPGTELFIDTAAFHEVFCADIPAETAAVMAVSQRPGDAHGFGEPTAAAAWKTLPSWALIGTADNTIGVSGLRLMAGRAGAISVEIDASHVAMISQPKATADLIRTALGSLA